MGSWEVITYTSVIGTLLYIYMSLCREYVDVICVCVNNIKEIISIGKSA